MKTFIGYITVVGLFVIARELGDLFDYFFEPAFLDWKSMFMFIAGSVYIIVLDKLEE